MLWYNKKQSLLLFRTFPVDQSSWSYVQSRSSSHQVIRQATLQWNFPSGNHCLAHVPMAATKQYPTTNSTQREKGACRIGFPLGNSIFTYTITWMVVFYAKLVDKYTSPINPVGVVLWVMLFVFVWLWFCWEFCSFSRIFCRCNIL